MKHFILICALINLVLAGLYEGKKHNVTALQTEREFDKTIIESKDIWIVELYTSWCNSCKELEPIWKETADHLKGAVRVAAMNVGDENG
jgi:protein disulfide-isomerase A6